MPDNELTFFLRGRYYICHEWIQRPFLHYVLSHSKHDFYRAEATPIARQCLQTCSTLIKIFALHHRHGAIWSVLRRCFGCSMLLLAASKTAFIDSSVDWQGGVKIAVDTLANWEAEAEDIAWMRRVLQDVLRRTLEQTERAG